MSGIVPASLLLHSHMPVSCTGATQTKHTDVMDMDMDMDTRTVTVLLLLLLHALALTSGSAAAAAKAGRSRQGDYLDTLRWSIALPRQDELAAPSLSARPRVYPQDGLRARDRVTRLPGQPREAGAGFAQYAGYVTVDGERALFYYLAEAAGSDSASKPLLLWLNGGPGCSSLGFGAMEELGPFRVMSDGKTLYSNPYSWNHVANVLFLESPAGVGFSYSNTTADYARFGDARTAEDAYAFLVNWMERFPEYKGRDFYIAGESYAGHYVPQLADTVLRHAAAAAPSPINLKGIMLGNGVINDATDSKGLYDFLWTHAIISDETIDGISKNCNFSDGGTTVTGSLCRQAAMKAGTEAGGIDIYNIYAPNCETAGLTVPPITPSIESFDPCTNNYVESYLNDPKVQEALHANVTKLGYPWSPCSQVLTNWTDSPSTVLPTIKKLSSNNIRVWVYSGDVDGRVPVTSSRYSVNQLHLPVVAPWRSWFSSTQGVGEVGGYVVQYKGNLSLVTVRGAGHEVPSHQPQRALVLVRYFLMDKPLPDCSSCTGSIP